MKKKLLHKSNKSYLSQKNIPPQERLIFALDVSSDSEARRLVEELGDAVNFYKLGLELFMAGGYYDLIKWLVEKKQKKVFVDLKFFDVPQTVQSAIRQLKGRGVTFATVHGNEEMLGAAVKEKNGLKILAVTVLTSLDNKDIQDLGFKVNIVELVLSRAKRALQLGCDGVISSGIEVPKLRATLGDQFLIVTPGIRPVANVDDQKRTVDVEEAFLAGADYIVVGRPIRDAPDRQKAAQDIQTRVQKLFASAK
ncbi:MAG: orotidine-5'-phosphate decarboxylase [Deltaproteobacteria bacterium]|nr:orotidine-5'-phosphate decarboxylase [Deltaproteobacteria bacterium]